MDGDSDGEELITFAGSACLLVGGIGVRGMRGLPAMHVSGEG